MVIADTGFWLALANQCDKHHEAVRRCLENLGEPLITTWPVMTETCHLLLHRLGEKAQRAFIHSFVNGAFQVFNLSHADASPIESYMKKYAKLPMDLADASLVVLADHLGQGRILSTDTRDFRTYRWKQRRPFENLLA